VPHPLALSFEGSVLRCEFRFSGSANKETKKQLDVEPPSTYLRQVM